jgi:ATP-grasp N-terminal domain
VSLPSRRTVLCLSSYFKGNRFLQACKREGCAVYLLTVEKHLASPWAREQLDEVFALPTFEDRRGVVNAVAYLMRTRPLDCVVALDDYDVDLAAHLREHFRLPGMGETTVRHFRDKLAMRVRGREIGVRVPEFVPLVNDDRVRQFLETVPPPWLVKPRSEASSVGIKTFHDAAAVRRRYDELGDDRSFHLLERMLPGELYHVDSLVVNGRVVFAEVSKYHRPLLEVYQGGGIYATRTLPRGLPEVAELRRINERVLTGFGLERGVSHTEFLRSSSDGEFYLIETSARVGGANIAEMVEAATGVSLWEEWARMEVGAGPYAVPPARQEYGGVVISLARQEHPDTSGFTDPEITYRLDQKHHVGLVVRSPSPERVEALLNDYLGRIARDFHAALPPAERATA